MPAYRSFIVGTSLSALPCHSLDSQAMAFDSAMSYPGRDQPGSGQYWLLVVVVVVVVVVVWGGGGKSRTNMASGPLEVRLPPNVGCVYLGCTPYKGMR